jgi:hypothetical protein
MTDCERERVRKFILKSGECWIWKGHLNRGIPTFTVSSEVHVSMRQYIFKVEGLESPAGRLSPTCHRILCIRPEHLKASSNGRQR